MDFHIFINIFFLFLYNLFLFHIRQYRDLVFQFFIFLFHLTLHLILIMFFLFLIFFLTSFHIFFIKISEQDPLSNLNFIKIFRFLYFIIFQSNHFAQFLIIIILYNLFLLNLLMIISVIICGSLLANQYLTRNAFTTFSHFFLFQKVSSRILTYVYCVFKYGMSLFFHNILCFLPQKHLFLSELLFFLFQFSFFTF